MSSETEWASPEELNFPVNVKKRQHYFVEILHWTSTVCWLQPHGATSEPDLSSLVASQLWFHLMEWLLNKCPWDLMPEIVKFSKSVAGWRRVFAQKHLLSLLHRPWRDQWCAQSRSPVSLRHCASSRGSCTCPSLFWAFNSVNCT